MRGVYKFKEELARKKSYICHNIRRLVLKIELFILKFLFIVQVSIVVSNEDPPCDIRLNIHVCILSVVILQQKQTEFKTKSK